MNLDSIKEIVKTAKDNGVTSLEVETADIKVTVNFGSTGSPVVHYGAPTQHSIPAPAAPQATTPAKAAASDAGLHVIKSPFVGTFYASASPGKPAYAKIGDKVKSGQPLCVLEAMKIMNEIDSDVSGEVVEICVDNESLVEFGQPLFKIRPN